MSDKKLTTWDPIEKPNGEYCSPSCGCGCLKIEFDECHRLAQHYKMAAAQLGMGDWEIRVWENRGWHWELRKLFWHLSPNILNRGEYQKGHKDRKSIIGWRCYTLEGPKGIGQVWGRGVTQRDAVEAARDLVREMLEGAKFIMDNFPPNN